MMQAEHLGPQHDNEGDHTLRRDVLRDSSVEVATVGPEHPLFDEAAELEYEVFLAKKFTEEQPERQLEEEYGPYRAGSTMNVALNEEGELVGALREIRAVPGSSGYKTFDDFETYVGQEHIKQIDPRRVLEIGTVAIPEGHRGTRTIIGLYHAVYQHAAEEGRTRLIASMDEKLYKTLGDTLGFKPFGPARKDYMGSTTVPVYADLTQAADHTQEKRPRIYNMIVYGRA